MSKRTEPSRKRPLEVLADLQAGHREAAIAGPLQARKYLERVIEGNQSIPNATKFFLYDLLADACAQTGQAERLVEAVTMARKYLTEAQSEASREYKEYFSSIRCYELGISAAVDEGRFDEALAICEEAIALGLGKAYDAKANSIRRML